MATADTSRLRLFVWTGFCPNYTDGLAFAIAKDETEARKMVAESYGYEPHTWGELTTHPITKKIAYSVHGGG